MYVECIPKNVWMLLEDNFSFFLEYLLFDSWNFQNLFSFKILLFSQLYTNYFNNTLYCTFFIFWWTYINCVKLLFFFNISLPTVDSTTLLLGMYVCSNAVAYSELFFFGGGWSIQLVIGFFGGGGEIEIIRTKIMCTYMIIVSHFEGPLWHPLYTPLFAYIA